MGGGVTIRYRGKYEKGLDITGPFYYFPTNGWDLSWSLQDAPLDLETCGSFRIWRENMVERHLF